MSSHSNVTELESEEKFDSFIKNSTLPALVDFYTTWCGPCKRVVPIIEELAKEYINKLRFARLDLDKVRPNIENHRITHVPTFMIFSQEGKVISHFVGALPKKEFLKHIENALEKQK
ncbi:MAG: thioredoxin family protein [Candidatus Hodarchaeota archaeon]